MKKCGEKAPFDGKKEARYRGEGRGRGDIHEKKDISSQSACSGQGGRRSGKICRPWDGEGGTGNCHKGEGGMSL